MLKPTGAIREPWDDYWNLEKTVPKMFSIVCNTDVLPRVWRFVMMSKWWVNELSSCIFLRYTQLVLEAAFNKYKILLGLTLVRFRMFGVERFSRNMPELALSGGLQYSSSKPVPQLWSSMYFILVGLSFESCEPWMEKFKAEPIFKILLIPGSASSRPSWHRMVWSVSVVEQRSDFRVLHPKNMNWKWTKHLNATRKHAQTSSAEAFLFPGITVIALLHWFANS